ncbi:helix-turn-helix domain-containing protein [Mucilaginibacter terrenus]|uniref:Helix-turn-helix domain-containing protein n=1 Tax=Mucilaginibacter terrenus TaxID=2482727 RepID=A0A3E2NU00_9SPHI|nr:helix-turn-helix domain-containing protein [Mucilaginibacter terrenus]RFZ84492.1 helix-turn-helix domain-containing protein [Mucilaginibacter terrenus]
MEQITVLYPEELCLLSTVACVLGTVEMFSQAERFWTSQGRIPKYQLLVAGTSGKKEYVRNLVSIKTDAHIAEIRKTKLIIIPSALPPKDTEDNAVMTDWIAKQHKAGADIASMCSGAFILAATGILDGKNCSTHWTHADKFRQLYPNVNLQANQLITDENGIYTNGGAYSFLNLLIYLIQKYYDRETAIYCSKYLQIEIDRNTQSVFSIFSGQKQHGDEIVQQAQEFIESNVDTKIFIEDLSSKFAIGRRNFDRRFIKATGNTPIEYAQRVKIETAKKAFETTRKTVNEVMYEVGYNDVKAFREVFRKITGMAPLAYRAKYNNTL